MIDVKKALSQRCYIIFDTNEQLRKFLCEHLIDVISKTYDDEKVLCIDFWYDDIYEETINNNRTGTIEEFEEDNLLEILPRYHHTELTITDDGE
jgi:hypothetical protein